MINKAKSLVMDYIDATFPNLSYTLFTVWQSKVLQNFKCLISSTIGLYFELTYDGDKECWYLDAYKKIDNVEVYDGVCEQRDQEPDM